MSYTMFIYAIVKKNIGTFVHTNRENYEFLFAYTSVTKSTIILSNLEPHFTQNV